MAGLPKDHNWEEAMQMASVNMDSRLNIIENLMTDNYGRIAVSQDDLMRQLMNRSIAAGTSFDYAAIEKIKEMMDEQSRGARTDTGVKIDAPVWGGDVSDAVARTHSGFPGTTGSTGPAPLKRGVDSSYIDVIIKIRVKLDEFLDGSNFLLKVMSPQAIREMVRELRHEIRELKRDQGISELMIIKHLEEELENDTIRRDSYTEAYDNDDIPF